MMILNHVTYLFMKYPYYLILWISCVTLCFGMNCSKMVQKESVIDTPKDHYLSGILKLTGNDISSAESDFMRAIELDKKSPYGYTGMATLELSRSNYKKGLKYVKKALKNDREFVDAYAIKGRIIALRKRGRKWFEEAIKPLDMALRLDPANQQALFFTGECYLTTQKYDKAQQFFSKAMKKQGYYTTKAEERYALVNKLIKVAPLSERAYSIALDDKINRSDLCVLLSDIVPIKDLLRHHYPREIAAINNKNLTVKNQNNTVPPDVTGHSMKKWIQDIISLHLADLDVYANGFFYPDNLVTRDQFAVIIQDLMVMMTGDISLSTMYIGSESPYPDVHQGYYAFNAISLCVEKGIMDVDPKTGYFDVDGTITGIDAIGMIRNLTRIIE